MFGAVTLFLLAMQSPGLPPDWELKPKAQQIAQDVERLRPLLARLQPSAWIAAGAPPAYEKQWRDSLDAIDHARSASERLAGEPSRLSAAVETLIRVEALLEHSTSLAQAVRRYQNPAIAEVLESETAAAGASRAWLRQHVHELALQREQELAAAESEAQRCRQQLHRPGARKR